MKISPYCMKRKENAIWRYEEGHVNRICVMINKYMIYKHRFYNQEERRKEMKWKKMRRRERRMIMKNGEEKIYGKMKENINNGGMEEWWNEDRRRSILKEKEKYYMYILPVSLCLLKCMINLWSPPVADFHRRMVKEWRVILTSAVEKWWR